MLRELKTTLRFGVLFLCRHAKWSFHANIKACQNLTMAYPSSPLKANMVVSINKE